MSSGRPCPTGKTKVPMTVTTLPKKLPKPSEYIQERLLSTAQRLAKSATDDCDTVPEIMALLPDKEGSVTDYLVPIDKPLFQPSPSKVWLQSFEPFKTYEVLINFRNIDKVIPDFKLF